MGPEGEAWNHRELFSGFESEGNFSGWVSNLLGTSDSFIPSNLSLSEWECLCFSYSFIVEVENFQFYRSINGEEFFLRMNHISECYHVLYKRCTDEIWDFLSWWYSHGTSLVAQMVKNLPAVWETQVWSLSLKDSLEKEIATYSQYSCLENSMDRGAWQATVYGVTKSRTQLSNYFHEILDSELICNALYSFFHFYLLIFEFFAF